MRQERVGNERKIWAMERQERKRQEKRKKSGEGQQRRKIEESGLLKGHTNETDFSTF